MRRLRRILSRRWPPYIVETDEYLNWLLCTVGGMFHRGNVRLLQFAIDRLPSAAAVVEIGIHCGQSTNVISYLLGKNGHDNPFFACDCWTVLGHRDHEPNIDSDYMRLIGGNADLERKAFVDFVRDSFLRNTRLFSKGRLPHAFDMPSDNFFQDWRSRQRSTDLFGREIVLGGPIALAFIDGGHLYDQAMADFRNVDVHLERGGFILMDDSDDGSTLGSARVAQYVRKRSDYRVAMKNPNYLFQKM
jgi:Methyltransferase domain